MVKSVWWIDKGRDRKKKIQKRQNTQYGLYNTLRWCAYFFLFFDNVWSALEQTHLCQTFDLNLRPVRVKGGMSLGNDMWHGWRNGIIMRNVIYEKCTLFWRQSICKSCYFFKFAGSTTMTIKSQEARFSATKILLLAIISRAAWHYRHYITKVGQWRKFALEDYAPFCYNFHAKEVCTINFIGFFLPFIVE